MWNHTIGQTVGYCWEKCAVNWEVEIVTLIMDSWYNICQSISLSRLFKIRIKPTYFQSILYHKFTSYEIQALKCGLLSDRTWSIYQKRKLKNFARILFCLSLRIEFCFTWVRKSSSWVNVYYHWNFVVHKKVQPLMLLSSMFLLI